MARRATGLPPAIAHRALAVVRPEDAANVYAQPRPEFRRLAGAGLLRPLTRGYYARVPQHRVGDQRWRPDLHAAAMGIAQADYGVDGAALMHLSAARTLGFVPRELAVAIVAAAKQRPDRMVNGGQVHFVKRDLTTLDLQRTQTELGPGWVTTIEQTLLDIAHRPALAIDDPQLIEQTLRALGRDADWDLVDELAAQQRKRAAARRARTVTDA
jgi:hypothetical protein